MPLPNHIIRRDVGVAAPRADRILVLVKEQAIRDQLATDLETDLVKYGITSNAPRVLCVTDGSVWTQDQFLDDHDIVVACIHQLWEKDNKHPSHLRRTLARFGLIFIDEQHYAFEQVMAIVNQASSSLCFGLTGTPIDAKGNLLNQCILFSEFGYQRANYEDNSVKYLSDDPAAFGIFVEELMIDEATLMERGQDKTVYDVDDEATYSKQFAPVRSVAERVVKHVKDCDEYLLFGATVAPHREHLANVYPDLEYPVHSMISVDTIVIGEMLVRHLNNMFENNRKLYPLGLGYRAEFVRSDVLEDGEEGRKVNKGQKLTPDHGWMRYKNLAC